MRKSECTLDVVVPVFNAPISDLKRCLDSIKFQTYNKWKCLIVDASTKLDITRFIEKFCEDNEQFGSIKVKNAGSSGNRNKALAFCNSEYVTFIDADDVIEPFFFEETLEVAKEDKSADIIMGITSEIKNNKSYIKDLHFSKELTIESYEEKSKLLSYLVAGISSQNTQYLDGILVGRVYPKIIRTDLVKNVRFSNKIIIHEDNLFSFETFEKAKKTVIIPKVYYKYYINNYSITNSKSDNKFELKKLINEIDFSKQLIETVRKSKYKIDESALGIRLTNSVLNYVYEIYGWASFNKSINRMLKSGILSSIPKFADYSKYPLNAKQKVIILSGRNLRKIIFVLMAVLRVVKLTGRKLISYKINKS